MASKTNRADEASACLLCGERRVGRFYCKPCGARSFRVTFIEGKYGSVDAAVAAVRHG